MKVVHFASAAALRRWLERHHATAAELYLGFYRKGSGKGGPTYAEALDELLCFGWIDGVVRRVDDVSFCHRVTPRKPGSIWSRINVGHVERLTRAGRMQPAGLAAYAARRADRTGVYSFERESATLPAGFTAIFRRERPAWAFWNRQPPGYRRTLTHWVTSAKQEATRRRRLDRLIAACQAGERLFT